LPEYRGEVSGCPGGVGAYDAGFIVMIVLSKKLKINFISSGHENKLIPKHWRHSRLYINCGVA